MLSNEQCDAVRLTMATEGWNAVMYPALLRYGNEAIKALVLLPSEREGDFKSLNDDQIRARIRAVEWMTTVWKNELAVNDANRRRDELDRQEQNSTANP